MVDETINDCDESGNSELYYAVKRNDLLATSRLLRLGASETINQDSENPLMCAISQKPPNLPIVKLLLKNIKEKDFELRDKKGKNILHLACEAGNDELLMILLQNEKFHKGVCRRQTESKDRNGLVPTDYTTNEKIINVINGIKAGLTLQQIQDGEFIEGHERLIEYIQKLGYKFDEEGICFGVAHMGVQTVLSKETEHFNERLQVMMKTPKDELMVKITLARDKYSKYSKDILDEIDKAEKEGQITHEERPAYEKYLEFSEAVKGQYITKEERMFLEIPAFIEGMLLYFQPWLYPDIVGTSSFTQDAMLSARFVLSKEIEKQKGISKKASFSGIYNNTELLDYFKSLEKAVENTEPEINHPFGLALSNVNHAISIGYDNTREKKWIFIDANHLPATYYSSPEEIAKKVQEGFFADNSKSVAFKTDMYVSKENSKEFSPVAKTWTNSKKWKAMHEVSAEKSNRFDSMNSNWLTVAAKAGHTEIVKNLLAIKGMNKGYELRLMSDLPKDGPLPNTLYLSKDGEYVARTTYGQTQGGTIANDSNIKLNKLEDTIQDPTFRNAVLEYTSSNEVHATRMVLNEALVSAAEWGRVDIVQALLEEGIDPNMKCAGVTPLSIAVENGQFEVVKSLLNSQGIKPDKPNDKGETPLDIATKKNNTQIAQALKTKEEELKKDDLPELRKKIIRHSISESKPFTENVESNKLIKDVTHSNPISHNPKKKHKT